MWRGLRLDVFFLSSVVPPPPHAPQPSHSTTPPPHPLSSHLFANLDPRRAKLDVHARPDVSTRRSNIAFPRLFDFRGRSLHPNIRGNTNMCAPQGNELGHSSTVYSYETWPTNFSLLVDRDSRLGSNYLPMEQK